MFRTAAVAVLGSVALIAPLGGTANALAELVPAETRNVVCGDTEDGTEMISGTLVLGNVRVVVGGSCTIVDSEVAGNVFARGAEDLFLLDTAVGLNVIASGVSGTVKIGNKVGCTYDPPVGNNVIVRDSNNVLICQVTAGENIIVRGNDGKITVRDNVAGENIMVNRNDAFTGERGGTLRVFGNEARVNLTVRDNDRIVRVDGNTAARIVVEGNLGEI